MPCGDPVDLKGPQDSSQVSHGWFEDRAALAECKLKHSSVVKFYVDRDKGLAGGK